MKTPWSNLIQYGVGFATIVVMAICGVILLAVVGTIVVLTKISMFVK